jgi:phage repressor protein C with HTH and peptisase S24 domain
MKPVLLVRKKGDLPLSGESLTELMREVLARGRLFRFRAKGSSMSPFIKDGDVVTVRPLGGSPPRTGDIVAFLHPATGRAAVHRVVRKTSGLFSLKGDNVLDGDGTLSLGQILGTVCRVERAGENVRLGRGRALIASLSRSGLLNKSLDVARRASGRKPGRGPK